MPGANNGQPRPDLIAKGEVAIRDAKKGSKRSVTVVLKTGDETPTNIDRDGDGVPDVNIDEDGDGEPDVNIDTDGDGEPDKNIKVPEEPGDPKTDDPADPADPTNPGNNGSNGGNGNNGGTTGGNGADDESTGTGNGASGQGGNSASGNGSGSGNDSGLGGAITSVRLALAQTGDSLMPLLTLMGLIGTSGLALLGASALRRRAEEKES